MKSCCFYHKVDLDGWCSAAVYVKAREERSFDEKARLYPFDHGCPFPPDEEMEEYDEIVFCDISPTEEFVDKFASKIVLLDHHQSSITKFRDDLLNGVFKSYCLPSPGNAYPSGCELTWNYFFKDLPVPPIVHMISEYDSWHDAEGRNMYVHLALNALQETRDPSSKKWKDLLEIREGSDELYALITDGRVIDQYLETTNLEYAKTYGYCAVFDRKIAVVLNKRGCGSKAFNGIYDENKHDMMIAWGYDGDVARVSLYSTKDDVDVSEVAKKFGGGGHKGAAGFVTTDWTISLFR